MLVADVRAQWRDLDRRIAAFDAEFVALDKGERRRPAPGNDSWRRRDNRNGSDRGDRQGRDFEHGRDLAAWLGLVPRQSTTGGKPRLLGISKRGNKYLRKLLIHGARAALPHVAEKDTPLGRWAKGLLGRVHPNVAVVALPTNLRASLGGTAKWPKVYRQGQRPWRRSRSARARRGADELMMFASGGSEMA